MEAVRSPTFEPVRAHWQALDERAAYYFQTSEWLALAEPNTNGEVVWTAVLEGGAPVAVAPLKRWRRSVAGVPFTVLSELRVFDGDPPLTEALAAPDAVGRISLTDVLDAAGRWDAAWLRRVRARSPWLELARRAGADVRPEPEVGVGVLETTVEADEWRRIVPANMRETLRKARKRIERHGGSEIEVVTGDGLDAAFERYVELESRGYKAGEGTALALPHMAGTRDLLHAYLHASGTGQIRMLRIGDRLAAAMLADTVGRTVFLHKPAYDEELSDCSPGNVLMADLVQACCGDPGVDRIDLENWQPWLQRWGMIREPTHTIVAFNRRSPLGAAAGAAWVLRRRLGR